jgi:hypothetical protein
MAVEEHKLCLLRSARNECRHVSGRWHWLNVTWIKSYRPSKLWFSLLSWCVVWLCLFLTLAHLDSGFTLTKYLIICHFDIITSEMLCCIAPSCHLKNSSYKVITGLTSWNNCWQDVSILVRSRVRFFVRISSTLTPVFMAFFSPSRQMLL